MPAPHLAYLFSRYPVVSQTFCDTEMLALEAAGFQLTVGSLNAPPTSFRHERLSRLQAEILYPPPSSVLDLPLAQAPRDQAWQKMVELATDHEQRYGKAFKSQVRARNAWWFAQRFREREIRHVHVHFANRATHSALFLKKAGFTFSFTAHAQDFMVDLGSHDLLREMASEAEFVVAVSDYSRGLLQELCPSAAEKIVRIYNGLNPADFVPVTPQPSTTLKILSVGRLIEFKGFQHLIEAMAELQRRGVEAELEIIGEGPWRRLLEGKIADLNLDGKVRLLGVQSQDQIKQKLQECQVFALACIVDEKGASDILPTVILEAMAASRPVVSTRLVGVPEMVDDGVTGLLAQPGDVTGLAELLASLAKDPARREALGKAGRQKLEQTFALTCTAGQLAQRFSKLQVVAGGKATTPQVGTLALLGVWPGESPELREELEFLSSRPELQVLAATASSSLEKGPQDPPRGLEFLPGAMVLESSWRYAPEAVAKAEALVDKCGPVDGEVFFREARRAVQTLEIVRRLGVKRVHALRSDTLLWAWLVAKLGGLKLSASVEAKPVLSRKALEILLGDADTGSVADPKLPADLRNRLPDRLQLGERPLKGGLFRKPVERRVDLATIWGEWLAVSS